jgi:hypothetical protein
VQAQSAFQNVSHQSIYPPRHSFTCISANVNIPTLHGRPVHKIQTWPWVWIYPWISGYLRRITIHAYFDWVGYPPSKIELDKEDNNVMLPIFGIIPEDIRPNYLLKNEDIFALITRLKPPQFYHLL